MEISLNYAISLENGTFINIHNKMKFELISVENGYATLVDSQGDSQVWNFNDFVKCHIHENDYRCRYGR